MTVEKALQFGEKQKLFGIVTEPLSDGADANTNNKPVILLLNAGLVHRVGPYRMAVDMARQFANLGHLVFRFDLSNIGDSASYRGEAEYRARTEQEIRAAEDLLADKYGSQQFVALGLCTGAMNAHIIAVADERIRGAVLLDAYAYPTPKSIFNRYLSKLRKMVGRGLLQRLSKKLRNGRSNQSDEIGEGVDYWVFPPKKEVEKELESLVERQVELLFVYAGSFEHFYNYPEQLRDNFPSVDFKNKLELHLLKHTDHMYTLYEDRVELIDIIKQWLLKNFT